MAITISGENNNDRILAQDGVIDEISGINIVGLLTASHINVGSNIQLGNAGIVTATTFVGNLTGNVNSTSPLLLQTGGSERFRITGNNELGIAGANYGSSGQVLTSGGSGSAVTWSTIPAQATISNNADNRVITGGSGVNLNGEANLTFNGSQLIVGSKNQINVSSIVTYSSDSSVRYQMSVSNTDGVNLLSKNTSGSFNTYKIDAGNFIVRTTGTNSPAERLHITSAGKILIGSTSARVESNGFASPLQVEGTATATSSVIIARNSANASSSQLIFQKSRGTSVGSNTVIQSGDAVGTIIFEGSDGTNTDPLASIIGACDGTPGTNDVPGRLVFSTTADGSASPTERLRITSGGQVNIGGDYAQTTWPLQVDIGTSNDGALRLRNDEISLQVAVHGTGHTYGREVSLNATRLDSNNDYPDLRLCGQGGIKLCVDANTERLSIKSDGKIEVPTTGKLSLGMSGPVAQFTVGTANGSRVIEIQGTDGVIRGYNRNSSAWAQIDFEASSYLFDCGGSEKLRIASDGVITAQKSALFGNTSDSFTAVNITSSTSGISELRFADTTANAGYVKYEHSNNALILATNATERVRIRGEGPHLLVGTGGDATYSEITESSSHAGLVIGSASVGNGGMVIRTSTTGTGRIYFADNSGTDGGRNRGQINYYHSSDYMSFATAGSQRWRITSDGTMYPQGTYKLGLNSNVAFRMGEVNSDKFVHRYGNSGSATTNQQEAIWYGGGITVMHDNATLSTSSYTWGLTGHRGYALFRLKNAAGAAIYAESGSITSNSDYRMKENIVEITNGIEAVKKLKPSEYNIRKTFNPLDDGKKHHGFVAHEVQEAIPDIGNIVSGTKDAMEEVFYGVDEDDVIPEGKKAGDSTGTFTDKPDYQGIDYGHMTPVLAAAIKELITKVETLESKVAALEGS